MEKQKFFLEVINSEKQMLALIHSKGILHNNVLDQYVKTRAGYENILLNSNQSMAERQEIEYRLWKLHYELINEFRKRIRPISNNNPEILKNDDKLSDEGLEGFKSFLSESSEFYGNLIKKIREICGLPPEIFIKDRRLLTVVDQIKTQECQHTCHRLLICLGDLARYNEIVKKTDACEWSTAAKYYLEASRTWPDSGNPHNQLALLATYVGDAFLALYHCVRSLSVKEPFPDAWRNIMLLFEENRSINLPSVSTDQVQFDFSNPLKRSYSKDARNEENCSPRDRLWPFLVRTISFLLIRSSSEEFPRILNSALHNLEALLSLDDAKLTVNFESYQSMDSSRSGPYRAIQLVSIFVFILHSTNETSKRDESTEKDGQINSVFTPLAFAAVFILMGRLTERCLREKQRNICPLSPAVLVFLEWLVGSLDKVQQPHDADERVKNALSYFLTALTDLLDRIGENEKRASPDYCTALWEDHELRGFYPLTIAHEKLDFDSDNNYRCRNEIRSHRIFLAATRIMSLSGSFRNQGEAEIASPKTQPMTIEIVEEEEVIVFKPKITRRNSAPLYISKDAFCPEETNSSQTELSEERLKRATSLSAYKKTEDNNCNITTDSFSFCSTTSNPGPPSLSGWALLEGGSVGPTKDFSRQKKLTPIEEIASTSFFDLSINESSPTHFAAPLIPSAPFLPDEGILGAAPVSGSTGRPAVYPQVGFVDGYAPFVGMSSSEWLYHYRNGQNMGGVNTNGPAFGNVFHANEVSGFDVCDQWGNRFVSSPVAHCFGGGGPHVHTNYSVGYQRGFVSYDEPQLLQYLKDKERQLQLWGPAYMGN
ncbi:hypothetical protein ACP275_13G160900 [Erythranthe tilingii]